MRLMITLVAESLHDADIHADIQAVLAYLTQQRVNVLGWEHLLDEGAAISEHGDSPTVIAREVSALRALWVVDMPSRSAAVELPKNAPGGAGTLEIRESYTPQTLARRRIRIRPRLLRRQGASPTPTDTSR